MAEIYLAPEDVSISDTAKVLVFLNNVQSAQEIASRIEIPNELDIGVKLGQRIINARAELGGSYSSLAQLMAVPLIGPERFTEIVTEITGKSALEIASSGLNGASAGQILALTSQFEQLKRQFSNTAELDQQRYRIELHTIEEAPFLGEVVTLRLKVVDRFRKVTKANMPVTIETNWGNLTYFKGYKVSQGSVVTARTGVDGTVEFKLHTPTSEPLTVDQQNELSNALRILSDTASVPEEARDDFVQLAELYQHPLNRDLRSAVDIHYKSRQERLVDTLNIPTSIYSWTYEQALVRVYLHPQDEEEAATVLSMAALPIEYRDWLAPWYQIYKEGLVNTGSLSDQLIRTLDFSADEAGLSSHMISNIQSFISAQNGLVGERIGQQASKEMVIRFLTDDMANLSNDTRATLFTVVGQASGSIQAGGGGTLAMADTIAVDVGRRTGVLSANQDLLNQMGLLENSIASHNDRLTGIEGATAGVDFGQLATDLNSFDTNFATFETNFSTFETGFSSFELNFTNFETNFASFETNYSTFSTDFNLFDTSYNQFSSDYLSFITSYDDFELRQIETIARIDSFDEGLSGFNEDLVGFEADIVSFNAGVVQFNAATDLLVLNITDGVNTALGTVRAGDGAVLIEPIESVEFTTTRRIVDTDGG